MADEQTVVDNEAKTLLDKTLLELVELFAAKPVLMVGLLVKLFRKQAQMRKQFNAAWFRFVNHGHSEGGNCVIPAIDAPVCNVGAVERPVSASFKEFLIENLLWCADHDCSDDDLLDFDFDFGYPDEARPASSRPPRAF